MNTNHYSRPDLCPPPQKPFCLDKLVKGLKIIYKVEQGTGEGELLLEVHTKQTFRKQTNKPNLCGPQSNGKVSLR